MVLHFCNTLNLWQKNTTHTRGKDITQNCGLRDEKIILDIDLAEMYGVETRALKKVVRRNSDRFPEDFMFELTMEEVHQVVSQNVIPPKSHLGGAVPFAFTENGVAMLSSVLKSIKAIEMNLTIIGTFVVRHLKRQV